MTIYVDDAIHRWRGKVWCHLFTDGNLDELHAFAKRLGLKRHWFQQPPQASWCHYDITASKRADAIELGAKPVDFWKTLEIAKGKKTVKRMKARMEASLRSRRASEGE